MMVCKGLVVAVVVLGEHMWYMEILCRLSGYIPENDGKAMTPKGSERGATTGKAVNLGRCPTKDTREGHTPLPLLPWHTTPHPG